MISDSTTESDNIMDFPCNAIWAGFTVQAGLGSLGSLNSERFLVLQFSFFPAFFMMQIDF